MGIGIFPRETSDRIRGNGHRGGSVGRQEFLYGKAWSETLEESPFPEVSKEQLELSLSAQIKWERDKGWI